MKFLDQSEVRLRIVDGAARLFFPSGFHRISMDDLARDLGMSKKTIYNHFSSKEELLRAVLERHTGEVEAGLQPLIGAKEAFPTKFHNIVHFLHGRMSVVSGAFLEDIRRHAPDCFRIIEDFRGRAIPLYFGRLFDEGIKGGYLEAGLSREILLRVLVQSIQSILRPEVMAELRLHPAAALDQILSLLLHGILTSSGRKAIRKK